MPGNNSGVQNEHDLTLALNNKTVNELLPTPKRFIHRLEPAIGRNDTIHATAVGGQGLKPDIQINLLNHDWNVSVKKGTGNSVHQENQSYFLHFCAELGMPEEVQDNFRLFLYGDGTVDGSGELEDRLTAQQAAELYGDQLQSVQSFFNRNKRALIERFLIYGRTGRELNIFANYLYHGTVESAEWCPLNDDAVDFLCTIPSPEAAPLCVGPFTVQTWNRNLQGEPAREGRRHSVQIKWANCREQIGEIDRYCYEIEQQAPAEEAPLQTTNQRVIGDNSQGFNNTDELISIINNARFRELNGVARHIVKTMFPNIAATERIFCSKLNNTIKGDILFTVNDEKKTLSVVMGSGNSVHQEKLTDFLAFCTHTLDMTDDEKTAYLRIHYGDGTTDGSGEIGSRLKNAEIKDRYYREIAIAQAFFDRNKRVLMERFLTLGKTMSSVADEHYIFYGTKASGQIADFENIFNELVEAEPLPSAILSIGSLSVQTWGRNLTGKPNMENRRESIQVKWANLVNDVVKASQATTNNIGTVHGDWDEYEFVAKLNRNKNHKFWTLLKDRLRIHDNANIYAVRVTTLVESALSNRPVKPKSDVYLVEADIDRQTLLNCNFWLDEDMLHENGIAFRKISDSGVSCKRPESNNYTYIKLTVNSFDGLFGTRILGAGISLFVTDNELVNNIDVLDGWGVSEEELRRYFHRYLNEQNIYGENANVLNSSFCRCVKRCAMDITKQKINSDYYLWQKIFCGKGLFEDPYYATYIYHNDNFNLNYRPRDYSITTGSGRYHGTFTVVIKP